MEPNALFTYYVRHHSTPVPRDKTALQGMYCIRRSYGDVGMVACEIVKSAPSLLRFQVRPLSDGVGNLDWVAYSALTDDAILFHSKGDMWACFNTLARNAQEVG